MLKQREKPKTFLKHNKLEEGFLALNQDRKRGRGTVLGGILGMCASSRQRRTAPFPYLSTYIYTCYNDLREVRKKVKSFSSNEILKILRDDGWVIKEQTGSHAQLKHSTKKGKVTLPHPKKKICRQEQSRASLNKRS